MKLTFQVEQEQDGRWIAEVPELSGVLCYADTANAAMAKAEALALRVLAEQIEQGETAPIPITISTAAE
jgi:predicted RNase H-like HicB family nuclease